VVPPLSPLSSMNTSERYLLEVIQDDDGQLCRENQLYPSELPPPDLPAVDTVDVTVATGVSGSK